MATSTLEAEYIAAAAAAREVLWLRKLLDDSYQPPGPSQLMCDNQGAIRLTQRAGGPARSKRIDVVHHFVRDRVARGDVDLTLVVTSAMVADIFTKPLATTGLAAWSAGHGLRDQDQGANAADARVGVLDMGYGFDCAPSHRNHSFGIRCPIKLPQPVWGDPATWHPLGRRKHQGSTRSTVCGA